MSPPSAPAPPVDVLVAVPAHDEEARIGGCLTSVGTALREARRAGVIRRARVAVGLHRCTDDTAREARAALAPFGELEAVLVEEQRVLRVGAVRTALVRAAARRPQPFGPDAWLLSTDADTVVPPDWVTGTLAVRGRGPVDLVLGLADLAGWGAGEAAHRAYRDLVEAGLSEAGHSHAYAANLAIRLGAFHAVGGFPALPHGEEHGLAEAVRAAGLVTVSSLAPRVLTSARMPGRADSGLGALLTRLARTDQPEDRSSPAG